MRLHIMTMPYLDHSYYISSVGSSLAGRGKRAIKDDVQRQDPRRCQGRNAVQDGSSVSNYC
jgi:hypothetical protein